MREMTRRLAGTAGLLFMLSGVGCTQVKFVQKNPYTGEIWTVYSHALGSDTVTYCPPTEGVQCTDAEILDAPPPVEAVPQ